MDATVNIDRCRETEGRESVAVVPHWRREGARTEAQSGWLEPDKNLVILRNPASSENLPERLALQSPEASRTSFPEGER